MSGFLFNPMYISHRFGDGYIVLLRIKGQSPELTPIMNYMSSTFPKAVLKECHHNMLQVDRAGQMTQNILKTWCMTAVSPVR